ncbi:MAG: aerial mycelium formation protein [Acidimicrobiia bacterium]|nr:aerial mycelium formation protein [Acidimicrobiia bacterium]
MPEDHHRRTDAVIEPPYLDGLDDLDIDGVRAKHEECLAVETEVSYVRRLAQARIDIVEAELDRRASGGTFTDLMARLPQILADDTPRPAPASSRLPRHLGPAPDIQWRRGLEHLIADATLVNLPTLSEEELTTTLTQLRELEHQVSVTRRALHRVIDSIEANLAERLKVEHA